MISGNENEAENKKIDHKDTTEIDLELGMNKNMINTYMKKLSNTEAELKKALLIYIYIHIYMYYTGASCNAAFSNWIY